MFRSQYTKINNQPEDEKTENSLLTQHSSQFDFPEEYSYLPYIPSPPKNPQDHIYRKLLETAPSSLHEWIKIRDRSSKLNQTLNAAFLAEQVKKINRIINEHYQTYLEREFALSWIKKTIIYELKNAALDYFRFIMQETNGDSIKRKTKIDELNTYFGDLIKINPEKICSSYCQCGPECSCSCNVLSQNNSLEKFEININALIKKINADKPIYSFFSTKLECINKRLEHCNRAIQKSLSNCYIHPSEIKNIYEENKNMPFDFNKSNFSWNIKKLERHLPFEIYTANISRNKTQETFNIISSQATIFINQMSQEEILQLESFLAPESANQLIYQINNIDLAIKDPNYLQLAPKKSNNIEENNSLLDQLEKANNLKNKVRQAKKTWINFEKQCKNKITAEFSQLEINILREQTFIENNIKLLENQKKLSALFATEYNRAKQVLFIQKEKIKLIKQNLFLTKQTQTDDNQIPTIEHVKNIDFIKENFIQVIRSHSSCETTIKQLQKFDISYQKKYSKLHESLRHDFSRAINTQINREKPTTARGAEILEENFAYYYGKLQPNIQAERKSIEEENDKPILRRIVNYCETYLTYLRKSTNRRIHEQAIEMVEMKRINQQPATSTSQILKLARKIESVDTINRLATNGIKAIRSEEVSTTIKEIYNMTNNEIGDALCEPRNIPKLFACCLPHTFFAPNSETKLLKPIIETLRTASVLRMV